MSALAVFPITVTEYLTKKRTLKEEYVFGLTLEGSSLP